MDYLNKYVKIYWKKYAIVLIFLIIEAFCDLMQPTIVSKIIDNGVLKNNMDYVFSMGRVMLLVTALGAMSAVTRNIISSNVSQRFGSKLREDLFEKIQSFSFSNIDKFQGASLMTRLTNDVNQVQNFAHGMMRIFVKAPLLCIGSLIMAALINPSMSLILLAVVPIIVVLIFINMRVGYPYFVKIQKSLDRVNAVMREYLAGIRVVKAFNRFDYEINRFEGANNDLAQISIKGTRILSIFNPLITLTVNIGIILLLWFGGVRVNSGNMQVGQIIAFTNYMTQILFSLIMLSHVFTMFIRAKASAERIGEVFAEENNINMKEETISFKETYGEIDFENVSFSYDGSKSEPVLKNITFTCDPGETLGIIGSTGAGKSTLVNLIPRFYDTTYGVVKVDGVDIKDLNLKDLREIIGIVPQKSTLFTGTIMENIKWGNEFATIKEVEEAAAISQAHEFICSFPEGYNTVLGQGGVNLSGGQKQRISIARALVKKPKILILDDSTSAVDVATEGKIREDLKRYSSNTICILIAQRITSVMGADRIIVLDNGSMVGMGTHEELMNDCDIYKEIFRSQIGKEGV
ncbi:ABC transporter ATP-binding protein/permease [Clostridium sp. MSJ-11]|uniref:ABC transporter ATP-binding protein/permease n=1 Tax=Clostridium mobile TaxID=2841512 RepID=A0ABS6EHJ9_9CLOT|nr:ABC transporter ATP-binding protein [Clostridium mobile]MBU5484682.1 ABC transporter ATP-binding protein/permease [Clostridium mobile]